MRGFAAVAVVVWAWSVQAADWEQVTEGAVSIRARPLADIPGGREVLAEGDMEAGLPDVQAALKDHDHFRFWMPYVTESRVLEAQPDGARVTYTRLDFPIISDRDFVLRVVDTEVPGANGIPVAYLQKWTPANDALPVRSGVVRLLHNEGSWNFTPRGEGRVHYVYRFIVEPGGSIPGFLAGVGQKDAVLDTVHAVEKRARKLASDRASAPTR
jgi:hypothetical protein